METNALRIRRLRLIMPMRGRGELEHRFASDLRARTHRTIDRSCLGKLIEEVVCLSSA